MMRSIKRYLFAWLLGSLLVGGLLVGVVTYLVTLAEMNEVFDAYLENAAKSIGRYHDSFDKSPVPGSDVRHTASLPERSDTPDDVEILTVTWTRDGQLIYTSDPRANLPFVGIEGLSLLVADDEEWIVYSNVTPGGVSQAAQRVAQRKFMAGESAAQVLPPMLVLLVVTGGLLVFGMRRGFAPLASAAQDVAARSAASLDPIPAEAVPAEVKPLVNSINDLLARLAKSFSLQRRFLADAAHELRTPVTALRLQLQLLRRAKSESAREQAYEELEKGIDRSQRLIEQLLAVARSEPDDESLRLQDVDADELVRSVVSAFNAKASHRGVDLGAQAGAGVRIRGDAEQLRVLLNNLVDNAIRYTPAGGTVDVEASDEGGAPRLSVTDSGPGIPVAERERVFDRFYRGESAAHPGAEAGGSGLGLAIVRTIAQRHGAHVSLHDRARGGGLEVQVSFPAFSGMALT